MSNTLPSNNEGSHPTRRANWLLSVTVALTVVCLFSLAAPAARADSWNFSLTDSVSTTIDFSFLTTATGTIFDDALNLDSPVVWNLNGLAQAATELWFFNVDGDFGFYLGDDFGSTILDQWTGSVPMFTGPLSEPTLPTFLPGVYAMNSGDLGYQGPFTLTLTLVQTPEPSSFLMLGAGLLGLLGLAGYKTRLGRQSAAGPA